jgi:thioredoxin reductase (NADPH)
MADVAIIGAGPVGLFGVFACGMVDLSCDVIDVLPQVGGQCQALYPEKPIYDIPGYPQISGGDLVTQLMKQADPFKPTFHLNQQVVGLKKDTENGFDLTTSAGTSLHPKAVIIAAGCGAFGPNRPPLENLELFEATGHIHYHVTRPDDFTDQTLVIAGGGDSALDWTLALAPRAKHIHLIHRRPRFRAAPESVKRLEALVASGRVTLHTPYQLASLSGEGGRLTTVSIASLDGETKELPTDHLLLFFGLSMDLGPIANWGLALTKHTLTINPATGETSIPGIFAAGDIAHYAGKLKLILTGFAEASRAAHSAYDFIYPDKPLHFEYSTSRGVPNQVTGDR